MELIFEFKRVYGRLKFYPVCEEAIAICEIAERLCLDQTQLGKLLVLKSLHVTVLNGGEKMSTSQIVALLTGSKLE